jgi:phage tail sheath gpL-like
MGTQALPTNGIRQVAFAGSIDTLASVTTIATGINSARLEIPWLLGADWTPAELAANHAAIAALFESPTPLRTNLNGFGLGANDASLWRIRAPRSNVVPSRSTRVTALNNGISTINVLPTGATYLERRVTTRSLSGANSDYRIRDPHKVRICDFFGDDWNAKIQAQFQGKQIGDDPLPGQRLPGPTVTTPRIVRASLYKLVDDYYDRSLLQNPDQIKAGAIVNREPGSTTRMSIRVPLQTADNFDTAATAVDQVG